MPSVLQACQRAELLLYFPKTPRGVVGDLVRLGACLAVQAKVFVPAEIAPAVLTQAWPKDPLIAESSGHGTSLHPGFRDAGGPSS